MRIQFILKQIKNTERIYTQNYQSTYIINVVN